jgi:hypothetical protein
VHDKWLNAKRAGELQSDISAKKAGVKGSGSLSQVSLDKEIKELNQITEELKQKKYVHIFPHSHTDEGWLARTKDFFTGADTAIYQGSVRDVLDSTMVELAADKSRTFVYAEMKYFRMWWDEQDEEMRKKVKEMVSSG